MPMSLYEYKKYIEYDVVFTSLPAHMKYQIAVLVGMMCKAIPDHVSYGTFSCAVCRHETDNCLVSLLFNDTCVGVVEQRCKTAEIYFSNSIKEYCKMNNLNHTPSMYVDDPYNGVCLQCTNVNGELLFTDGELFVQLTYIVEHFGDNFDGYQLLQQDTTTE
jgi:hypothetical protein